ncbi:MAG TPA: FadR/GntR family transcriptional regulator [Acidobacteriaceae bacterium]|nr:FadR/GntR family transcriptional regulator [Acidobacteriaceae bacterium]
MEIAPVASQRLYQQVADRLQSLLSSGELAVGDRLPPEKELAARLRVSRPTVREALIALEIAGFIETRTGAGTYVRNLEGTRSRAMDIDHAAGPLELAKARFMIEGEVAASAATNATAGDLDAIQKSILTMEEATVKRFNTHPSDLSFHCCIAIAAKNEILVDIVNQLWTGMFSPMFHRTSEHIHSRKYQEETLRDHKAIFAAIAGKNPSAARSAMHTHLRKIQLLLIDEERRSKATKPARRSVIL